VRFDPTGFPDCVGGGVVDVEEGDEDPEHAARVIESTTAAAALAEKY
jgi:hypothetical protein